MTWKVPNRRGRSSWLLAQAVLGVTAGDGPIAAPLDAELGLIGLSWN